MHDERVSTDPHAKGDIVSDEAPAAIASASGTRAWRLVLPLVVATLTPGCARAPEPPKDDEAMARARCNRPEDIARGCTPLTPEDAAARWFPPSSGEVLPGDGPGRRHAGCDHDRRGRGTARQAGRHAADAGIPAAGPDGADAGRPHGPLPDARRAKGPQRLDDVGRRQRRLLGLAEHRVRVHRPPDADRLAAACGPVRHCRHHQRAGHDAGRGARRVRAVARPAARPRGARLAPRLSGEGVPVDCQTGSDGRHVRPGHRARRSAAARARWRG